jgi:hypothetical protein
MTALVPAADPAASPQAVVDAALLLLDRMGLSPEDLLAVPRKRPVLPTFAEYVPVVSAVVTAGTAEPMGRTGTGSWSSGVTGGWMSRRRRRSGSWWRTSRRTWWPGGTRVAGAARLSIWWLRCGACTGTLKTTG